MQATDLLLDGFSFALATALGVSAHALPPQLLNASNLNGTTLYGTSNMQSPRVTPISPIKHVFLIYLESGESLAWPYSPKFCQERNCSDIAPEYDTPEYFTPFFNSLVNEDPNAVLLKGFRSNVAFTTKAQLASECGVLPEIYDGVHNEATMKTSLPCLPDLLRAVDERFKSSKFIAQDISTDFYGDTANQTGWDQMFGREKMEKAWGETRPLSNWWGYSDEEVAPFWWDWIDERLKNDDRIFMSWSGATMHLPFALPPFMEPKQYTAGSQVSNGYLNTVRYTDQQLKLLFDGLRTRGILDESLIILQGDHGPRIAPEGWTGIWGWFERIYQTPFVVRAPGLIADRIKQDLRKPFVSLDILPTIMDALGVDPAIIDRYPGQSVLRHRGPGAMRDTFHVQIPGNQYPHVIRYGKRQHLKARRTPDGDTCVGDIIRDEKEDFVYCANVGWDARIYVDENGADQWGTGVDAGLWKEGSEDELEVIAFAKEAQALLDQHLETNAAYWDSSNADRYARSNSLFLEQLSRQAEEEHSLKSYMSRFRI